MECSYAPRGQVAAWLRRGWRLIPEHHYEANDWAVVMCRPEEPEELTGWQIRSLGRRFKRDMAPPQSNRHRAAITRHLEREKKKYPTYDSRRLVQESP